MIEFFAEEVNFPELNIDKVRVWISETIQSYNCNLGALNFIFCNDNYLLALNKEYLGHDYFTDILTFNYNEENYISGDLFISVDRVCENAKNLNIPFENEILRVCIHGILHLVGLEDRTAELMNLMRMEEDKLLNIFLNAK